MNTPTMTMKTLLRNILAITIVCWTGATWAAEPARLPKLVDLGADKCIPCKMMVPILAKMEKQYAGRAAVVFLDVWKDRSPVKRFGIRAIPTQIFFDKDGKEVYRHEGFLSDEEIVRRFKDMGVK